MPMSFSISGGTLVTPTRVLPNRAIVVEDGDIVALRGRADLHVSLADGSFVYPALLNVHDHMRGNYLPKVGPSNGHFYTNWNSWNDDLQGSTTVAERNRALSIEDIYYLSSYKNLLSGVVTVHDHFPHEWNEPFVSRQPLRVIRDYALAHDVSQWGLPWGDGVEVEHRRAVERDVPFITHLEEGFGEEIQRGIDVLDELGCLDDHAVLIHCIGFTDADIQKTRNAGAHVAWCAGSNIFMFNATCKIRKLIKAGVNVAIGTDSTHTGEVNLLEEVRFARQTYRRMYNEDLSAKTLVKMVTVNPAKAFRIAGRTGSVAPGMAADLLAIAPRHDDPYEALVGAQIEDIELLTYEGTPLFGSLDFADLFAESGGQFSEVSIRGRRKLVTGDPQGLLDKLRSALGFHKELEFLPLDDVARTNNGSSVAGRQRRR